MRTVAIRLIWAVIGLATITTGTVLAVHGIGTYGLADQNPYVQPIRTFTVAGTITSVTVQSYGDPVWVTAGNVKHVQVSETVDYNPQQGGRPPLEQTVSHGHLTLGDPSCFYGNYSCDVSYSVIVPRGVSATVQSYGGNVTLAGTAGADVDTFGGAVTATRIAGPLTVSTGGGPFLVNGLTGALSADTAGGPLDGTALTAPVVTAITGGGDTRLVFSAAPDQVMVSTDGGAAVLALPGGPYALSASDDQGGTAIHVPVSVISRRLITVNSGGGTILIAPLPG